MNTAATAPSVSIIIPSHNRAGLLERVLDALERQTYPISATEIVVCADGCRDNTLELLRSKSNLPLSVVELPGIGPGGARNSGVEAARAPLVIFLDDDIVPTADFVAEHMRMQQAHPGAVVLGPYPPVPIGSPSLFRQVLQQWWTRHFSALARPGHRLSYTDVLTGNLSTTKATWQKVGGLNPDLRAHEDYELGIRLIAAKIPIVFAPHAFAHHYEHETMDVAGALRRVKEEGRADVLIARMHPEVGYGLKVTAWRRSSSLKSNLADKAIFAAGPRLDRVANWGVQLLLVLDRHGLRNKHSQLFRFLRTYWYLRGIAEHLPSFSAWKSFARSLPPPTDEPPLPADLRAGFEAAELELDRARPSSANLYYGERLIGRLPHSPGSEPWAGRHLRPFVIANLGPQYLRALAADGQVTSAGPEAIARLDAALAKMSKYYPIRRSPYVWGEQLEQWRSVPVVENEP